MIYYITDSESGSPPSTSGLSRTTTPAEMSVISSRFLALLLEPKTLQAILTFFDNMMASMHQRWAMLLQTNTVLLQMPLSPSSTSTGSDPAAESTPTSPETAQAEAETEAECESFLLDCRIACYKHILAEMDRLEADVEHLKALKRVVQGLKEAVERQSYY